MAHSEIVQIQLDQVKSLVEEEWLLDFTLPDLDTAIRGLYEALGETHRLDKKPQKLGNKTLS